jgi:predicted  nucleic acid-binding Zn-ribbon protein
MNISKQLFELQKIDLQLDEWKARQIQIKTILADDSKIKSSEKEIKTLEAKLAEAEKELKIAEYEVNEQIDRIKINEGRLYGGKINSPKELEDLQMESAAFKKRLAALEDTQLDYMMKFEDAYTYYSKSVDAHSALISDTDIEHKQLQIEFENLECKIKELKPQRDAFSQSFDPDHLKIYEGIRVKRKGVAVVEFTDKSCPACGVMLTSSQGQLARSPSTITQCETCSRIFYTN